MKNKKIWSIGLCGAICLSIAGVTYASYESALTSDTPKVSTSETGNTSSADILYQDTDDGQISVDGKNWVDEADYEKNNAAPDVQWWTCSIFTQVFCIIPLALCGSQARLNVPSDFFQSSI